MRPTAEEVMNSIIWTFEEQVMPAIEDPLAASLSLTIKNLLRHVRLRMQLEGEALAADNDQLVRLLATVRSFAEQLDEGNPVRSQLIEQSTAEDAAAPFVPTAALVDRATALRGKLDASIRMLQDHRPEFGASERYDEIRHSIRGYLRDQVEREAAWITPAFTGLRR